MAAEFGWTGYLGIVRVSSKETGMRLINYRRNQEFLHPDDGTSERARTNNELVIIQDPSTRTPICWQGWTRHCTIITRYARNNPAPRKIPKSSANRSLPSRPIGTESRPIRSPSQTRQAQRIHRGRDSFSATRDPQSVTHNKRSCSTIKTPPRAT